MIAVHLRNTAGSAGATFRKLQGAWSVRFLLLSRAVTVGVAYVAVTGIPGLTSSFVAIFVALIAFDLMVAAPSLSPRRAGFEPLVIKLRQALAQTVASLGKGLSLGVLFGILALLGFPDILGAIMTAGGGYTWANRSPQSFTGYVAILGGLVVFERIQAVHAAHDVAAVLTHVFPVAMAAAIGTITALCAGWAVGIVIGVIVRSMLARPYRTRHSSAYDPPFEIRPFEEVIHGGREHRLLQMRIEEGSPLVGRSLAELGWRDAYQATVIAIERGREELSLPRGSDRLQAGDVLLVFCPMREFEQLSWLTKPMSGGLSK